MKNLRIASAAVILLLLGPGVLSQTESEKSHYPVHPTSGPITVDGKVTPEEWSKAGEALVLIFPWDEQTGAKQMTQVRLLWDSQKLYLAYECEDTDITARFTERDSWVYRDDTVELFLNVLPSQQAGYYCVEVKRPRRRDGLLLFQRRTLHQGLPDGRPRNRNPNRRHAQSA